MREQYRVGVKKERRKTLGIFRQLVEILDEQRQEGAGRPPATESLLSGHEGLSPDIQFDSERRLCEHFLCLGGQSGLMLHIIHRFLGVCGLGVQLALLLDRDRARVAMKLDRRTCPGKGAAVALERTCNELPQTLSGMLVQRLGFFSKSPFPFAARFCVWALDAESPYATARRNICAHLLDGQSLLTKRALRGAAQSSRDAALHPTAQMSHGCVIQNGGEAAGRLST